MFGLKRKPDLFDVLYRTPNPPQEPALPRVQVSALPAMRTRISFNDGEKFPGGYGPTNLLITDYWTLRQRSAELFETNLYARGIIRRLVTNVINEGLHLEATPNEKLLGYKEDELGDWTEDVEDRWEIWAKNAYLCDHDERATFGALMAAAYQEALVVGDVLVVMRQDPRTRLPRIQLVNGALVQTPLGAKLQAGHRIVHGVEIDAQKRQVAYWILQEDGTSKRLPAIGEKSGRRIAWLLYGSDKRLDDVRGKPLLSLVIQSMKEIDRYRDSTQRKAVLLAMLALYIQKGVGKPGSRPITTGARRRALATDVDETGKARVFHTAEHIPGLVLDELEQGEEPKAFNINGTIEKFGEFEEAIVQSVAWCLQIPPEILTLSFNSNYSASQAALNEFKIFLNPERTRLGDNFCSPIYEDFLLASVLDQRIEADGFLEAWRDYRQYDRLGAWVLCDWSGNVKPAVDPLKLVKSYDGMVASGYITRDRATRELTGTKYSKNVKKLRRENEQLAEANKPLVELEAAANPAPPAPEREPKETDESDDGADDNNDDGKVEERAAS